MATATQQQVKAGRRYIFPSKPPYELEVPSVTTIISGGIPKEALQYWAAKKVAEYAVEHIESWKNLPREDAIDLLKRAPTRFTGQAAGRGSDIHDWMHEYVKGAPAVNVPIQARGAMGFLDDFKVEVVHSEVTIFSREHKYAGTTDLIANVTMPGEMVEQTAMIDYKTGKAIYDDYSVQLAAYAFGDFIAGENDTELKMPKLSRGIIVRPTMEGKYQARVYKMIPDLFELFLSAYTIYNRNEIYKEAFELDYGVTS